MKRRRLSDLYVRGKEVVLDDGAGESVTVWLQKLNGVDRESCLRRANAAKARFMIDADDEGSDNFQSMYAQVRVMADREGLIAIIIGEELTKQRQRVEAQLMAEETSWGKDNYIQGLIDSWIGDDDNPGLARAQAEDPEDPEAQRVLAEIERFEAEVSKAVREHTERELLDWAEVADDVIWRKAAHRLLEMRGNETFNNEFERQQLFFCVREPEDKKKRYFGTLAEIDDIDEDVVKALLRQYGEMIVDTTEGKDSRASRPSSTSSEPLSAEEASSDSGLEDANV